MRQGKTYKVPTGNIFTMEGSNGKMLEFLSIGDYGKELNVKADFLGLNRPINGVPSGPCMPLEDKWVITISSQYGCSMGCKFCNVPLVGAGYNVHVDDLIRQIQTAICSEDTLTTKRLNIHYARMGEPSFNSGVVESAYKLETAVSQCGLSARVIHPVVSTMMPNMNTSLMEFLSEWCYIKNKVFSGDAGLQLSINSTDEAQRQEMFNGNSLRLEEISRMVATLPAPVGRKYCLNFAWADGFETDGVKLAALFNPKYWMVKITPIHATKRAKEHGYLTSKGYEFFDPYAPVEKSFTDAGFDTLVFIPSIEEDDSGITCGNAVLSNVAQ